MKKDLTKKLRKHYVSLKIKWALTVAAGIFVTFLVFAGLLVSVMSNALIQQEQNTVRDTLSAVNERLSSLKSNLTIAQVVPRLDSTTTSSTPGELPSSTTDGNSQASVFQDSVIQKLSRADIAVSVYDREGEQIFASRNVETPLVKRRSTQIVKENINLTMGLVGRGAIYSTVTGKIIGYMQVTNKLSAYHETMKTLQTYLLVFAILAIMLSWLIGYVLASRFLNPIRSMSKTMQQINQEPQADVRLPASKRQDEIGDLINEFNGMLDRIQRYIDQQGEFVQDVSHELRTPVAILEGHLQLLNRWGKDDPAVLNESLAASLQEVMRMKSLIQEMLDLTRADQVDVQFPNKITNVGEVIKLEYENFKLIHPDFVFTLDEDLRGPTFVRIYRNHFEQLLIILLDNAVKYSTKRQEVHLSIASSEQAVDIVVQDFGEGIKPEDRSRIFNRFYRVDKARSREKGGNGLGLSIAGKLVESYHGKISVESSLGSGSAFRVTFPLLTDDQAQVLMAKEAAQAELSAESTEIKSEL